MPSQFRALFMAALLLAIPLSATAQFNLIEKVPDQIDDEWGISGQSVIEAPNGDVLIFYARNGEITDTSTQPWQGLPATLVVQRKTKGLFWEAPVILDTAIENGFQSLGQPITALLPDGRILLTYFYHLELFPNFAVTHKTMVSADSGVTWAPLNDKDRESAAWSVTPEGTLVSVDWVDDGEGNLSFHSSVYDMDTDSWSPGGFITGFDQLCSLAFHAESDTEWHFYYADCFFGYGGTNQIFRQVTTDAGATWSEAEERFTAESGVGGTLGSIVATGNGNLMAVYSNSTFITYRTSSDGGDTWSDASNWTGNTMEYGDYAPKCSTSTLGPLCLFQARRDTVNPVLHIGLAGISGDPLSVGASFSMNAGFNDAWYSPATPGQGFLISVFPRIQQVFVAWFTFDTERPADSVEAQLGEPGHRWLTAQGPFEGERADLTLYVSKGGVFDSAEPAAEVDPAGDGRMVIEFSDCYEGVVTYEITSLDISGEIPIQRITNDNVPLCEQFRGQ